MDYKHGKDRENTRIDRGKAGKKKRKRGREKEEERKKEEEERRRIKETKTGRWGERGGKINNERKTQTRSRRETIPHKTRTRHAQIKDPRGGKTHKQTFVAVLLSGLPPLNVHASHFSRGEDEQERFLKGTLQKSSLTPPCTSGSLILEKQTDLGNPDGPR
jgi:hypothetical protein